jgi:hypothetical protein
MSDSPRLARPMQLDTSMPRIRPPPSIRLHEDTSNSHDGSSHPLLTPTNSGQSLGAHRAKIDECTDDEDTKIVTKKGKSKTKVTDRPSSNSGNHLHVVNSGARALSLPNAAEQSIVNPRRSSIMVGVEHMAHLLMSAPISHHSRKGRSVAIVRLANAVIVAQYCNNTHIFRWYS